MLLEDWVLEDWVSESMYAAAVELENALSNFPVY
jgi:hypothetical protein